MAWIFSLSAECGSNPEDAARFAQHFHQVSGWLSNGLECKFSAETFQDSEDNWWNIVFPIGVSQVGITTPEDAYQMTEIGIILDKNLRLAPSFRYALVGIEVDEFRTYSELIEADNQSAINFPGLVLAEKVWQLMGCPVGFQPFKSGYFWKPYEGEVYKPLIASSDLKNKFNELLSVPT
jgi:hypothetical protein